MTVIQPYLRFTFRLKITGQKEIAEVHLTAGDPSGTLTDMQSVVDALSSSDLADLNDNFWPIADASGYYKSKYLEYNLVKVAAVGTDEKYQGEAAKLDLTGTFGAVDTIPPQSSWVISLVTESTHRWGKRGRMFMPCTMASMDSGTPFLSSTSCQNLADAAAAQLDDINTQIAGWDSSLELVVVHHKTEANYYPVTSAYVGNVLDTQKRRRNKLEETYYHHDLS